MSRKKVIRKFGILLIAINLAIVCQSPMKAMENDSNEKKSHFDDNTWIMNKALAQWNLHYLYMDVYEMVYLH